MLSCIRVDCTSLSILLLQTVVVCCVVSKLSKSRTSRFMCKTHLDCRHRYRLEVQFLVEESFTYAVHITEQLSVGVDTAHR